MILGDITLRDFEVPPAIQFGNNQRMAIHRLAGGGRVIDTLGRDDADIEFSGTLSGSDAADRAAQISILCGSGLPTALAWDAYYFRVIVKEFSADYKSNRWIPYRLSCVICSTDAASSIGSITSVVDTVAADIQQATALFPAGSLAYASVTKSLTQSSIPARNSTAYLAAVSELSELDSQITTCLIAAEQEGTEPEHAGFDLANPVADRIGRMVESAGAIAILTTARAYTRRALARFLDGSE